MKIAFVQYLKNKVKRKAKLHNAELNMAKKPQVA
jgi:hypothetical protein